MRMRLGVVASAPHGGLLHYGAQLAEALAARGHRVNLITGRNNELAGRLREATLREVLGARVVPSEPPTGPRYLLRRVASALRLVRQYPPLIREVRRGGYDLVLFVDNFDITLAVLPMVLLGRLPRGPRLAAVCHEPLPRSRWRTGDLYLDAPLLRRALCDLYPRFDLVLVHGERSRAQFERAWSPARATVIPHGDQRIMGEAPMTPASEPRILFFGDWRRAKGLPELMRAFDRLIVRMPEARITIAGIPSPDGDPEEVRAWAARSQERVRLVDHYVPLESVPELFASARVVATPYLAGSQSGVVHLAMTMGRAVVSSDIGELPEVVKDGETGLVVPAGDVDALALALARLLADPELAGRMGEAARLRLMQHSSWERVAEAVEQALESRGPAIA